MREARRGLLASRRGFLPMFAAACVAPVPFTRKAVAQVAGAQGKAGGATAPGAPRGKPRSLAAAPRFARLDGTAVDLGDLLGQPVLVNLWATWCPPCVAELPSLQRLRDARRQATAGERLEVVALNVGQSINQVETFLASLQSPLALPIVLDAERHALAYWSVKVLPTTLVFDTRGDLRSTITGERDWSSAEAAATIAVALRTR